MDNVPNSGEKIIWPCGAIARSMFQDDIQIYYKDGVDEVKVELKKKGLAWESDKEYKFKNPDGWNQTAFQENHVKPES